MYKLYTGTHWRMLDGGVSKVKGGTAHKVFQEWVHAGVLTFYLHCFAVHLIKI